MGVVYIVLLDDLVEASVVELNELGKIMDIGNNVAEVLFQEQKLLLAGPVLAKATLVETVHDFLDFPLADSNSSRDLHGLDLLLRMDLFEFDLELPHESGLVLLGPFLAIGLDRPCGILQIAFQSIIVDVVPLVLMDHRGSQLFAEFHHDDTGLKLERAWMRSGPSSITILQVLDNQHVRMTGNRERAKEMPECKVCRDGSRDKFMQDAAHLKGKKKQGARLIRRCNTHEIRRDWIERAHHRVMRRLLGDEQGTMMMLVRFDQATIWFGELANHMCLQGNVDGAGGTL